METLIVGVVGVAGIAATLLAPAYARRWTAERAERRDVRAAARLVAHDLNLISVHLNVLVDQGRAGRDDVERLPLAGWEDARSTLAAALPWEDWQALTNAFGRAESLRSLFNVRGSLDGKTRDLLVETAKKAQAARDLLAPLGH